MIRQATSSDAATVAPLLYDAIHDIAYTLTGTSTRTEALQGLIYWMQQPANRLSFQNTWVYCIDDQPVGMMILYRGDEASELDRPLQQHLVNRGLVAELDVETEGNVLYIDTVSVHPSFGGRGIGSQLLHFAEQMALDLRTEGVALNVDEENPAARRLYERLGYADHSKRVISGAHFSYMVKSVAPTKNTFAR